MGLLKIYGYTRIYPYPYYSTRTRPVPVKLLPVPVPAGTGTGNPRVRVYSHSPNSNLCHHGTWSLQTDGQTDRQTDESNLNTAVCTSASRGKNLIQLSIANRIEPKPLIKNTTRNERKLKNPRSTHHPERLRKRKHCKIPFLLAKQFSKRWPVEFHFVIFVAQKYFGKARN